MSAEEIEAEQREKTDAAMNRWIVSRVNNSRRVRLARQIFGTAKEE